MITFSQADFKKMTILRKLIVITLLFICIPAVGQTTVRLSKPRLELRDNIIDISYDILNSDQTIKFKVWIEVTDSTENKIIPKSISGDIGENVSGGSNKKISWDFVADSIYLDDGIYVQVYSELIPTEINKGLNTQEAFKPDMEIRRGGVIFQSLLFPGWGLSRINRGQPHWIKGIAGYGLIVSSIYYNKTAVLNYNNYLDSENSSDIDNYFNTSVKKDKLSKVFAYSAIGIWVIDAIWTISGSSKLSNHQVTGQSGKMFIYPVYDPDLQSSMVALKINF